METIRPVLRWPGAKWNVAGWIVEHLPRHTCYLEPWLGSGAVFFSKPPSAKETINDLDSRVCNLFRVLREQPEALARAVALTPYARAECEAALAEGCSCGGNVEQARRFLVAYWMRVGYHSGGWRTSKKSNASANAVWNAVPERIRAAAERLKDAQIECRPAEDLLRRYHDPEVLVYADPPYLPETRTDRLYQHDMTTDEHAALLDLLDDHPGPVLLSAYDSPLYTARLADWTRLTCEALALTGERRTEILWLNPEARKRLNQRTLDFDGGSQ